ncbi:MAG: hypothetical protein NVS3B20_10600 [Polyangiales bacterium]
MSVNLLFAAFTASGHAQASPSSGAAILVRQGREHEANGDSLTAIKRYTDALFLDPAAEEAYLALGSVREKQGDLAEAEVVYSLGSKNVSSSSEVVLGRGRVRRLRGQLSEAANDVSLAMRMIGRVSSRTEVAALQEWILLKQNQKELAAELGGWRRLLVVARTLADVALTKDASLKVRALGVFLGDIDPAMRGASESNADLRTFAAIARRGG